MANEPWLDYQETPTASAPATGPWDDYGTTAAPAQPSVPPSAPTRSFGERFSDEFKAGTSTGFPGLVARKLYDWADIGMEDLRKKYPGHDDAWYEKTHEDAIAQTQRGILEEANAKAEADPTWRPDEDWLSNIASGRWLATVGGLGAGSSGPEMLFNPGATWQSRALSQAGIGGASDLGYQGLEIADNVRDKISVGEALASAAFGGGMSALGDAAGAAVRTLRGEAPKKWANEDEFQAATKALLEDPNSTREQFDALAQQYGRQPFSEDLDAALANRQNPTAVTTGQETPAGLNAAQDEATIAAARQQRINDYYKDRYGIEPERVEVDTPDSAEALPTNVQPIVDYANELEGSWKNAPEIGVYEHFDDAEGIDPRSLGFYNPETGEVALNTKMIEAEAKARKITTQEMTNTVLFHEGLGHFGLAQKFRDDLDAVLTKFDENSNWFRGKVDAMEQKYGDWYADEFNPRARIAEEVLAEMSEGGKMPAKLLDTIKNKIKEFAREIGFDLQFSEREIKTILSQVHDAVINGKGADVAGNGFRSNLRPMRSRMGESEGTLQGGTVSEGDVEVSGLGPIRTNRVVDPALRDFAPERETQSWDEWVSDAERTKMTRRQAENLALGIETSDLLAARMKGLQSLNRITDLMNKSKNMTLSPREWQTLQREQESFNRILQSVSDVRAEIGRLLNSNKIEVGSDKAMSDKMMKMIATADLTDPIQMAKVNEAIAAEAKNAKSKEAWQKAVNVMREIVSLPRAMQSTLDLSAPLRQGRALVHTKAFWKNVIPMFQMAASSANFRNAMAEIQSRPTFKLMEDSGLFLADTGKQLTKREEQFMSTWAGKIPGFGRAVKFSERGYTGFLNKLRADTFDRILTEGKRAGMDYELDRDAAKKMANFVNTATGRGEIKHFTTDGPLMNALFYSPRLIASRVQMLNPAYYMSLPPQVRKEAITALLATGGLTTLLAGLAQQSGIAKVETDPRSSDFMKIKVGNTRYDTLGGFGQYMTLGARLLTNQTKNAKKDLVDLGKGFKADTRFDVMMDFLTNKFSPIASYVKEFMQGKDFKGEPFDAKKATVERFVPLFAQDILEAYEKEGLAGAAKTSPSFFGVGVQTYDPPKGGDVYGRSYATDREATPAITEMQRVSEAVGREVLNSPRDTITINGEKRKLTEDELNQYKQLAGEWTTQLVEEEMNSPDWAALSDEEKFDLIKDIANDMRANAREQLFGGIENESGPWNDFNGE